MTKKKIELKDVKEQKLSEKVKGGAAPYLKEYFSTLEEARANTELFSDLPLHGFMEGFICFDMTARKYPRSIRSMTSHEDITFWIEEKCTDDRTHDRNG